MKTFLKHFNRWDVLILLSLLTLAAFMRLYRIEEYLTFLGDEGRDVLVAKHILEGNLVSLGPTASVGGFFFGPAYYYMMAPFLFLFNYNPIGPAIMVGLIGTITVGLVYLLGKEFFGRKAGFIAALLYSIAPVVVYYSRSSWNPNPVPFFSILAVYAVYKAVEKNSLKLFLLAGFLLGLVIQLHFIVFFFGVSLFFYIFLTNFVFISKQARSFKRLLKIYGVMLIGFLIAWAPYIIFELRRDFLNSRNIFKFIFQSPDVGSGEEGNVIMTLGNVFTRLFSRVVFNLPTPDQHQWYPKEAVFFWILIGIIVGVASLMLLIIQTRKLYIKNTLQFHRNLLLLLWFFSFVFFGFYKKNIYDYYFGYIFPVVFLLVGNFSAYILDKKNIFLKVIISAVLVFAVAINLYGIPFRYPGNNQLNQVKSIAQFVYDKTNGKPYNFALITGGNSDHAYRYFFELWGNSPVVIEYPGKDPKRKTVTDQLFVVCETVPCEPVGHSLWEIAGFGKAEIEDSWEVSVVKVYKLRPYIPPPDKK